MKTTLLSHKIAVLVAGILAPVALLQAGTDSAVSAKSGPAVAPEAPYEAGRGLLTLQGPTGMFINPTSATLPAHAFTAQYCFFLPENSGDVWGHGAIVSYGVTDWLELGGIGSLIATGDDPIGAGPMVRVRLLKNDGWIPQFSVGGYTVFGDDPVERYSMYAAAYNRIPLDENGLVKSIGVHSGVRQTWFSDDDQFYVYGGLELQLPWRLYLVGEVSTTNSGSNTVPYSYGLQWRAKGINISAAEIQNGAEGNPGFFFGIGLGWQF